MNIKATLPLSTDSFLSGRGITFSDHLPDFICSRSGIISLLFLFFLTQKKTETWFEAQFLFNCVSGDVDSKALVSLGELWAIWKFPNWCALLDDHST